MPSPGYELKSILNIYRGAVKNVPILKYSWILIAAICVLALTAYFKLKNSDVFGYALALILISFLGFVFSFLLKSKDNTVRFLLYFLISSIVLTMSVIIISFASFIIFKSPDFFNRWFDKKTVEEENKIAQKNNSDNSSLTNAKITIAYDSILSPSNTILSSNITFTPLPIVDTVTKIAPLYYNVKNRKSVKLIFYSKMRNIRDTLNVPTDITPEKLLENLYYHYKLLDIVGKYDHSKLRIEWRIIHEYNDIETVEENLKIKELKWKNYDMINVKYSFSTPEVMFCPWK